METMKYLILVLVLAGCAGDRIMQPGEEFKLGSRITCCDCCLVHNITYRIEDNQVFVRMWRNEYLTEKCRDVNE